MTARESLEQKAIQLLYHDYNHYCDCRDYNLIEIEAVVWLEEYGELVLNEYKKENSTIQTIPFSLQNDISCKLNQFKPD